MDERLVVRYMTRFHRCAHPLLIATLFFTMYAAVDAQVTEEWEVFSTLNVGSSIATDLEGNVWVGTTGGAYRYNTTTGESQVYRTVDALLRLDVSAVGVNPDNGDIYFGSTDGSVSILRSGGWWTYVTDVAQAERPNREITGFAFDQGGIYILTSFGVAVFNSQDSTIRDSWTRLGTIPANTQVNDVLHFNDSIWVATEEGIAAAPSTGKDLADPSNWTVYDQSVVCNPRALSLTLIDGVLNIGTGDGGCTYRDGEFTKRFDLTGPIRFSGSAGNLIAGSEYQLFAYGENRFVELGSSQTSMVDATALPDGTPVGVLQRGGVLYPVGSELASFAPNGPVSNVFESMAFDDRGGLWVGSGRQGRGLSRLVDDSTWITYTASETSGLFHNGVWEVNADEQGRIWAGTYGGGFSVFSLGDGLDVSVTHYDRSNSPLRGFQNDADLIVTGPVADDGFGGVWMVNWSNASDAPGAAVLISLVRDEFTGQEEFHSYPALSYPSRLYSELVIDFNGTKWLGAEGSQGLLYFKEDAPGGSTGEWGRLNTSNGLISSTQTALLVDPDGELWIGTPSGLTVLVNPGGVVLDGPGAAIYRTVRPLEDLGVTALAVDALNRKWVGTNDGILVLSSDGTDVLKTFTSDNSPLVNNQILSILPDDETGDVYIGTVNGLVKVKTEAIRSTQIDRLSVTPQPYTVPATEPMRITGLPENSTVKVLTLSGALVREFRAPGGDIGFWNGTDDSGEPVATGVYIIAAESAQGETVIGKAAIVRE